MEGTTATVRKYKQLIRRILPVMRSRGQDYQNCRRMTINKVVQEHFREVEVGFVGMFYCEGCTHKLVKKVPEN